MRKFIDWIKGSFEHGTHGASARKVTAFAVTACVVFAHVSWIRYSFQKDNFSLLPEILMIDYGFIAVLLGLSTYQYIRQNGKEKDSDSV